MSRKQQIRQGYRDRGRYAKVNPCYLCGRSAGEGYNSHPLTDCVGSDGVPFDDIALCLCDRCAAATQNMTTTTEISRYADQLSKGKK